MIKIGITGSLGSGKTTACKIISKRRGPIYNADVEVKRLYKNKSFKKLITKKFKLHQNTNVKKELRDKIIKNKNYLKKLEKIIHPIVRKIMINFSKINKKRNFTFYEIPLLAEKKMSKHFDFTIFIKSKKSLRQKRYLKNGGNLNLFKLLDGYQLIDKKKQKYCDYTVVNNGSFSDLKKKLFNIIKKYEKNIFRHRNYWLIFQ